MPQAFLEKLCFNSEGLIPAIIQEQGTGKVLMMAWMDRHSLLKTMETQQTYFWSRSRQKYWMKGETSGHIQQVKRISLDCDGDVLLIEVEQRGAACHEGYKSCFYRDITLEGKIKENAKRLVQPENMNKKKIRKASGDSTS